MCDVLQVLRIAAEAKAQQATARLQAVEELTQLLNTQLQQKLNKVSVHDPVGACGIQALSLLQQLNWQCGLQWQSLKLPKCLSKVCIDSMQLKC
jgi:hypothetical protein